MPKPLLTHQQMHDEGHIESELDEAELAAASTQQALQHQVQQAAADGKSSPRLFSSERAGFIVPAGADEQRQDQEHKQQHSASARKAGSAVPFPTTLSTATPDWSALREQQQKHEQESHVKQSAMEL